MEHPTHAKTRYAKNEREACAWEPPYSLSHNTPKCNLQLNRIIGETREESGPIESGKMPADVRQEPYNLPAGFMWCEVDMTDEQEAKEVYDLLNQNYVEDDDNMFRFDYSPTFLEWALTPPGNQKDFVVGIRVTPSAAALAKGKGRGKLVGFITGVPVQMRVYEQIMPMVEINFLCVLKKLRSKRLAPVLIKEITRRVNLTGVSPQLCI